MRVNILVYPGMTMLDAMGPYEVLSRLPGAGIQFVGVTPDPITSDTGCMTFMPTCALADSGPGDVLLVPGGPEPAVMTVARDPQAQQWLRAQHEASRYTASVCTGALILIAAGIVTRGGVATHWAAADAVAELGLEYTGERITRTGKLFTAAGVSAGIDLALALSAEIAGAPVAEAIQVAIEYDPAPPFPYKGDDQATRQRVLELFARNRD